MDVSVVITERTKYQHIAWSAGWCSNCGQLEAVRIENAIQVISFYFIPFYRHAVGTVGRCDFCERPIDSVISTVQASLAEWHPQKGLGLLLRQIAPSAQVELPANNAEHRLRSLLASTQRAASINGMDITFGVTTGLIIGPLLTIPLGIYVFDVGLIETHLDRLGVIFLSLFGGLALGAPGGALLQFGLLRRRVAKRKIRDAYSKYKIDLRKLNDLSRDYGRLVRWAVHRIQKDAVAGELGSNYRTMH
jgi:hypothetical protein